MEQTHKHNYSRQCNSIFTKRELPQKMTLNKAKPLNTSIDEPQPKTNGKLKSFRGFFKQLPFMGGNKTNEAHENDQTKINNEVPLMEDEDIRKLISLYAQYEILYNPKHSQYGNNQLQMIYYSDIARSFPNKTGAQVQAQIQELRQLFESEYANVHNAYHESGEDVMPSIKYYNEFLFLEPFLANGSSCDSLAEKTSSMSGMSNLSCKSLYMPHKSSGNIGRIMTNSLGLPSQISGSNCFPCCRKKSNLKRETSDTMSSSAEKDAKLKENQKRVQIKEDKQHKEQQTSFHNHPQQQQDQSQHQDVLDEQQTCQHDCYIPQVESNHPVQENSQEVAQEKPCEKPPPSYQCPAECSRKRIAIIRVGQRQPQGSPQAANNREPQYTPVAKNLHQPTRQAYGNQDSRVRRVPHSQPRPDEKHRQQVQMLCDMIRTELGAAPDFIYFEAKWRIIEILREVNKRQLMYTKGVQPNRPAEEPKEKMALDHLKAAHCPFCPKR